MIINGETKGIINAGDMTDVTQKVINQSRPDVDWLAVELDLFALRDYLAKAVLPDMVKSQLKNMADEAEIAKCEQNESKLKQTLKKMGSFGVEFLKEAMASTLAAIATYVIFDK